MIFTIFINCIVCTTYDNIDDSKTVPIDDQEIIRRRNIAENYLKENINVDKNWIETYHTSFSEKPIFSSEKTVQDTSPDNVYQVTFPSPYADLSQLKILHNSGQHENLLDRRKLVIDSKDKTILAKTSNDKTENEFSKFDKNSNEIQDSARIDNSAIFESLTAVNDMVSLKVHKKHYESASMSNNFGKIHSTSDVFNDNKLEPIVNFNSKIKKDFLNLNKFKNISTETDKIIQVLVNNFEFTSKKYFIHSKTLTLTELNKLEKYLSSLSFLQKSKNNVYSFDRMKIIDSIGEITLLFKQDKFNKENQQQSCKSSNTDNNITEKTFKYGKNLMKKSIPQFKKRLGFKAEYTEKTAQKSYEDLSLLEFERNILPNSLKKSEKNYFSLDPEIHRRKKLMNSFISTLSNNQENWIETYHLNDVKSKNNHIIGKQDGLHKIHSQERLYIIRWINKLKNKLKNSHNNYHSLSISVSIDLYETLGKLSEEFDIVMFDELVDNMISNATLHDYTNAIYLGSETIFNGIYLLLNEPKTYIFIIILTICYFSICNLFCNTESNYNLVWIRLTSTIVKHFKWVVFFTALSFSVYLTGYKMYQQKIARKHSVMSSVVPEYCESILNEESGVFAHIKEQFRLWWHGENCRKYYEAVMVDPSSEITFFSIITDLLSDALFQMLQPFARNMNIFFKELTHNLSLQHQFFIVIITIFLMLSLFYFCLSFYAFHHKYKVNFPFFLGSVEPTKFCKGSRVEELDEKETSPLKIFSSCCDAPHNNCLDKTESENCDDLVVSKEKNLKVEARKFKLDELEPFIFKIPRSRSNSI